MAMDSPLAPEQESRLSSAVPQHDFVIEGGWVLADRDGEQTLLRDASVVVREGTIAEVVEGGVRGREQRIDARRLLVLPGFISGHTHTAAGTPTRGIVDGGRFYDRPTVLVETLTDDELDDLTAYNVADLMRSGCTTFVEMSASLRQAESFLRVARRWGVRAYLSAMIPGVTRLFDIWFRDDDQTLYDSVTETLEEIRRAHEFGRTINHAEDDRIRAQMGPHAADTHTPETLAAVLAAARDLGNGIHIHVAQRAREAEMTERLWGMRPVEWLEHLGLFDVPVFAAHLSHMDLQRDPEILNRHAVTQGHCACAFSLIGGETAPYPEALHAGVNVSLGTDTTSTDYVENIKLATLNGQLRHSLLHATSPVGMTRPSVRDAVHSATVAGARGLRRDDLGAIRAGAKADLCCIDVTGPIVGNGALPPEPLNHLLYANALSVKHVVCDGNVQVHHGVLAVDDEERVAQAGGAAAEKLWARLRAEGWFERRASHEPLK